MCDLGLQVAILEGHLLAAAGVNARRRGDDATVVMELRLLRRAPVARSPQGAFPLAHSRRTPASCSVTCMYFKATTLRPWPRASGCQAVTPVEEPQPAGCGCTCATTGRRRHLADNSRHANAWACSIYTAARARGCDHTHAIRILARAWLRVIWRAWPTADPTTPNCTAAPCSSPPKEVDPGCLTPQRLPQVQVRVRRAHAPRVGQHAFDDRAELEQLAQRRGSVPTEITSAAALSRTSAC